ncbi:MAG: phosphatase PAP2 family protein [Microbacteriaceae bacterium]
MPPAVSTRRHRWQSPRVLGSIAAIAVVALVAGLGLIITLRGEENLSVDAAWMADIVEHRHPAWEVPSLLFDFLGGGIVGVFVVPIALILVLLLTKRRWGALYFALATMLSAGLVQILKHTFGRARPEDILVVSDFGSFPSGHTANAATMAVTLALILQRAWVWIAGILWTVAMLLSRTYLGAHWLSDTAGGLLVGAAVATILWAVFARRLRRERERIRPA